MGNKADVHSGDLHTTLADFEWICDARNSRDVYSDLNEVLRPGWRTLDSGRSTKMGILGLMGSECLRMAGIITVFLSLGNIGRAWTRAIEVRIPQAQ